MTKKIIIDCDPGHDDAFALLIALANPDKVTTLAVGTVGGNHHVDKITHNAARILESLNVDIPLYVGSKEPLVRVLPVQPGAHGASGMDGPTYVNECQYPIEDKFAVEAYAEIIRKEKQVSLVGLGPLTNLALLIKAYPDVIKNIEEISIMGGGLSHGNVTPTAEFNIFADPEAASIVFKSGIPIKMAGLDVTEHAYLKVDEIEKMKEFGELGSYFYSILNFYHNSGKQFGYEFSGIHDACATAYLVDETIFETCDYYVEISLDHETQGMTIADKRKKTSHEANVVALMDVNRNKFKQLIFDALKYFSGDDNA